MPMDLANLLADTLTARGYEVEEAPPLEGKSGATYAATLVAARDGKRFLVDVLASKPVDGSDLEALQSVVDDTAVDGALLLALGDEAREVGAPHEGVEVWPRPRVARAVGDRLLEAELDASAEAIGPSPDPTSAPDEEPAAATRPDTTPGPAAPATADDGAELLGSDAGADSTPQPPEQEPARAQADAPADPSEATPAQAEPSPQGSTPANGSDPSPNTGEADPEPEPTPDPTPEPRAQPEAEPEPAAAPEGGDAAATGSNAASSEPSAASEGPDEFLSPEEMAERAAQMAEGGGPEDGDAELLTDDDPTPEPDPATEEPEQGQGSPAPGAQEPAQPGGSQATAPDPGATSETPSEGPGAEGQAEPAEADEDEPDLEGATVFEDADAALLPSKPSRPADAEEAPAQETATDAQPDPSTSPQEPASAGSGQAATGGSLAAAAPVQDEDEPFLSGGCVVPRVGEQEARHEAEGAVFEVDEVRLELLPFHVFDYSCRLEGDGTTRQDEGRVWVSAQSGAVVNAPKGDLVEDPGVPNERFQGSVPADRAVHQAKDHLLDNLERREELREDHSETAVIERVTLSPQAETLSLDLVGKAYAPRWRVEGQNGTVFVDAISGDLVPA